MLTALALAASLSGIFFDGAHRDVKYMEVYPNVVEYHSYYANITVVGKITPIPFKCPVKAKRCYKMTYALNGKHLAEIGTDGILKWSPKVTNEQKDILIQQMVNNIID